ncbi:9,11-endoperoxide prostaglandin H2 reductase-like [Clavelina lepadiformis]|uniref:9,11-endoperoxide prostaglandin H2 reductase-like n=1 Tax=Clavelina lepadiformis TaxID=159417 RepID=UPI004041B173
MNVTSKLQLSSGNFIPLVGLGTFQIKNPEDVKRSLNCALSCGYRLIDTAAVYKNEQLIGDCLPSLLAEHKLTRDDVFITTKLGPKDMSRDKVSRAFEESLTKLGVDHIDLYLIHWPGRQGTQGSDERNKIYRREVWTALEEIYLKTQKIKSLGVSNFTLRHLQELSDHCKVMPAVVQNEHHPDFQDIEVVEFCKKCDIHLQAYSSLGQSKLVADERYKSIAQKYDKTVSQILLRWSLQNSRSVIPKSVQPAHIRENISLFDFEISESDMKLISDQGKSTKYAWDPDHVS